MRASPRRLCLGLALAAALCARTPLGAILLSVIPGNYAEVIDESDLTGGAGSNLTATYTSASTITRMDVTGTASALDAWRVDVRRIDTSWHASLTLRVRRSSDGADCALPTSAPTGGVAYQNVETTDTALFSGSGDRCGINVQYQVTGLSVAIPPAAYSTTVMYTVVDI